MDELTPNQWIAKCAQRLGERWRTVPPGELEAAAVEVWGDEKLRSLPPDDAATRWLAPISQPEIERATTAGAWLPGATSSLPRAS